MTRIKGAKDKVKRKIRKDKGKKRKKIKNTIKFKKKQGSKTELKLYIWQKRPMSREGYKRWRKKLRPRLTKIVYVPIQRIDVNVKDICNEKLLLQFMIDNFYPGYFLVKGGSGSLKSIFKFKWVTICEVEIKKTVEGGLVADIRKDRRLSKYGWFYKK